MTQTPDNDYRAIFSHPEMVIDVLTGFIPGPWLDDIDFATLEPFKSQFESGVKMAKRRKAAKLEFCHRQTGASGLAQAYATYIHAGRHY